MASRIPISPLSAAHILVSWIMAHGREPQARECRQPNGLLTHRCFLNKIPASTFSACISAARVMVSHAPKPRMQHCLGSDCTAMFVFQGYHFCETCRKALGYAEEDTNATGRFLRAHDREAATREGGIEVATGRTVRASMSDDVLYLSALSGQTMRAPLLDEEESEDSAASWHDRETTMDDTVSGFDDLIASQMNAWSRVSRKRRFFEGA